MAEYTRKQVIEEAQELAKKLSKIEEIDRFRQLEIKINENKKVQAHIAKIKALQKQAFNLQHYDKHGALEQVEAELDRYQKELDEIPIVQEFKDSQVVVNDILQRVTKTIADEVTNEIVGESDEDVHACEANRN